MTAEEIKLELGEVKYYYSNRASMDSFSEELGESEAFKMAQKYNSVMGRAPAKLYTLYGFLYLQGKSQKEVAAELFYSPEYIRKLNHNLISYLIKVLSTKGGDKNEI